MHDLVWTRESVCTSVLCERMSALVGELQILYTHAYVRVCMHICVRGWKILQRDGAALVWEENIGDWTPWMEFPNLESGWEQVRYV